MIKTFIDSGVLIFAARGEGELAEKALSILEDSDREFASSIFIQLEILPKAIYNKKQTEINFYNTYFEAVSYWATDLEKIIKQGLEEASNYSTGAMDSLHIASAKLLEVDEFITNEKPNKSIHRSQSINIISLYDL
ncbi:hypothetical protein GM3708_3555 (plasmid) [Geminocystis sp. NIES-3708]|uniref:type II toxin-antitoxin system VapC family toxin n=1 Tax=Geminocystis sp. NIES-3708 TaxID=1615909 RepID=UPI0005FC50F3|nr:nucleic acid-binding protein [Geminocystis sp. NIES-3708]BAQ63149.1 hypothetical protein GM3708_3555 [Geminocystis sp. NIES-3708]